MLLNRMKFVKGQWYKNHNDNYAKFDYISGTYRFNFTECIQKDKYKVEINWWVIDDKDCKWRNIDINEIKHLLPKDYKFEQELNYYFY